jgi:quercetin dioxygenase-like cupin family protein
MPGIVADSKIEGTGAAGIRVVMKQPVEVYLGWECDETIMSMDPEAKSLSHREHEVGNLNLPLLKLDLGNEIQELRSEGRWQSGHTAKTLVKYPDFRVVLVVMNAGGRLEQHRTEGRISVHTLQGHIRFHVAEQTVEMPAGHLLALESGIPHDVEGVLDSAFLLTIAWPAK